MYKQSTTQADFSLDSYNYELPQANIAQHPAEKRDGSKLLILNKTTSSVTHSSFSDILNLFRKGDILVVNDTKVFPARLLGRKATGGKAEVFLLELPKPLRKGDEHGKSICKCAALIKSSKKPKIGNEITISDQLSCRVAGHLENGKVEIELHHSEDIDITEILQHDGSVPLPPYILRNSGTSAEDRTRYQTVYAAKTGAVAAPTAGLHFTRSTLDLLGDKGVGIAALTLHVGYGTFAPVRCEAIKDHKIHSEFIALSAETAERINTVKRNGGKVWAVGTTTVRALESACGENGLVQSSQGWCDLYIVPGFKFKVIDNLITNFHLPKSSLLFLVSALCGREMLLESYREAIANDYRFYSYGDAMAIIS